MKLIVGLGNPGPEYDRTRHNVGFVVLDRLARRHSPGSIARAKFQGAMIDASIDDEKVVLLKPLTFMNRSGQCVQEAVAFYKIDVMHDLLVLVDDLALPCGSIRLRGDGSAGGHNGLADIEQKLATRMYPRVRIGIDGRGQVPQKDYVLGRFRPEQETLMEPALEEAVEAAEVWCRQSLTEAMNRFNGRAAVEEVEARKSP